MMTLSEFKNSLDSDDFQRSNMFSVIFSSSPSSNTQKALSSVGGMIYSNLSLDNNWLGLRPGEFTQGITSILTAGTQKIVRSSGISKYLIGAMTNRTVQSLLGEFSVGTSVLDFFNMAFPTTGLMIYRIKIPDSKYSYEVDKTFNAPNMRTTSRDFEPIVISFRMDEKALNYRAMTDWVNSVIDPVTNLRALPSDVEADLQVNLHNRKGLPHTVAMFNGVIPVSVGTPEMSFEDNSSIMTFDVTFFYRKMSIGSVGKQAVLDWLQDKADTAIDGINANMSLNTTSSRLSTLRNYL